MNLEKFFRKRSEKIIHSNPQFGFLINGFKYITTDKGEYKLSSDGEIFSFNQGVLDKDKKRWEELEK